jgi:UDP-4-amino-4,6-dideoxy-N-acetyl-beta-L-altrosamine transaminase
MIPYGRQNISDADIQAVVDVLRSDFLTQGPAIERFETAVANYCGARYAVAVNSATAALHIACLSSGLGPGDALWTTPITFVASANCGLYCGASVDFVDIDPCTYNMSVSALSEKLAHTQASGGILPKVVIPVHLAGQSCDMQAMQALSREYGFTLIEDASHAIGGKYQGQTIGSCQFSAMTVFSFHPVKIVTTGEGGMVLTNDPELYESLLLLRSHGITRNAAHMENEPHGAWYYEQIALGFNYRITDIQAALGASQMSRIDTFVQRRHALVQRYNTALADLPITLPWQHPDTFSAFHLYIIRLQNDTPAANRSWPEAGTLPNPDKAESNTHQRVFEQLRTAGIGVNLHYIPVHTQPYYQQLGFRAGDFPEAERYYEQAISLPLFYDLTDAEQDQVIAALRSILKSESRPLSPAIPQ